MSARRPARFRPSRRRTASWALSIAGGWIEGMYLGSAGLKKEKPSEAIMNTIANQKYAIENLISLLELYNQDETKQLREKLIPIKSGFDKIVETSSPSSVNSNEKIAVIEGGSTLQYTPEIIFEITQNIKKLRDEIIQ